MEIKPIRTEADYKATLQMVSDLMEVPDPIDAIEFFMEKQGLRLKDLQPMLGGLGIATEVLLRAPMTAPQRAAIGV